MLRIIFLSDWFNNLVSHLDIVDSYVLMGYRPNENGCVELVT